MKPSLRSLVFAALVVASAARADMPVATPPASAWTVGTGADYSRGDYGFTADTEVFSVPLNLGYENGPWRFHASVPWLTIRGPAAITGAGGAARPTAASESGLGDIFAGASYALGQVGPVALGFTGRAKLPTADESRGLGTGETDLYAQLDFSRTFDRSTPFASVGYRVLGDSAAYQLQDGLYASAGAHFRVSPVTVWTIAGNWGRRIIAGGDPTADALLMFNRDLAGQWRFTAYALKGFTDASPDFGAGLALSRRL